MSIDKYERTAPAPMDLPVAQTINPYWEAVRTIPGNRIDWEYDHIWMPDWSAALFDEEGHLKPEQERVTRDGLCGKYAWAIPDPASLEFVKAHAGAGIVEIGAGTGYWAWQLAQLGVNILAYDLFPPQHTGQNHYHSPRNKDKSGLLGEVREVFFNVKAGNHLMAAQHPDRTLFLCWPPYDDDMAYQALKAYTGKRLIYIGEGDGGCTADEAFFKRLSRKWEEVAEHRPVQWWGIHDYVTVYERK